VDQRRALRALRRAFATVVRFPDLHTATKALEVRTDELLGSGYVLRDAPFRELLAKHEPWLSWNRAAVSSEPLVGLWRGLASAEDREGGARDEGHRSSRRRDPAGQRVGLADVRAAALSR
jgi:hypothetical protein